MLQNQNGISSCFSNRNSSQQIFYWFGPQARLRSLQPRDESVALPHEVGGQRRVQARKTERWRNAGIAAITTKYHLSVKSVSYIVTTSGLDPKIVTRWYFVTRRYPYNNKVVFLAKFGFGKIVSQADIWVTWWQSQYPIPIVHHCGVLTHSWGRGKRRGPGGKAVSGAEASWRPRLHFSHIQIWPHICQSIPLWVSGI